MTSTLVVVCVLCFALTVFAQEPVVWVASPWQHVLKSTPPGPDRSVSLQSAANEYESMRIIVRAGDAALADVNASASALTGAGGEIAAANTTLFREHYINVFAPSYASSAPTGWYPDALIPFVSPADGSELTGATYDAAPFSVEPNTNQGIWADVRVPPNTPPGDYTGKVTVTVGGKPLAEVPVTLSVWGFSLPDTLAMQSNFGGIGGGVAKAHGVDAGSPEFAAIQDRYMDALLEHRCIPSSLGNIWPKWTPETGLDDSASGPRLRQMIEERHVNSLALPFAYRDEPEKCKAYLKAIAGYLREKGWLDLAYIYLEDEPNDAEQYETVRQQGKLIHEADAGIRRMCTEQSITSNPEWGDLYGAVDIWCPLWFLHDEKTGRERQAQGETLWSYTALCQGPKTAPFWQIDFEPVAFRAPFWVSWHFDIKGFLYWASVYWTEGQDQWVEPHFRSNYWGEGMLLYPGKPAGIAGPVTSIRLKLIREAMEDFEYMTLAAKGGRREQVNAIVDTLARSFTDWEHDPARYAQARGQLAELIVANP